MNRLLFLCKLSILLNLIKGTVALQQENNLDPSLANVDLDNPSIINQLNRELIRGENEALNLVKSRAALSNGSQSDLLDGRRPPYDLSCYTCSTDDDPSCEQVNQTRNVELVKRCKPSEPFCSVLRIEYRVSKEANWTLWVVERSCERTCEPICLQLGERTRLKFCNECCQEPLCNVSNADTVIQANLLLVLILLAISIFL